MNVIPVLGARVSTQFSSDHMDRMLSFKKVQVGEAWVVLALCTCSSWLHGYWVFDEEPTDLNELMKLEDIPEEFRKHLLSRVPDHLSGLKFRKNLTAA